MRPRLSGSGFALCSSLALVMGGCGGAVSASVGAKAGGAPGAPPVEASRASAEMADAAPMPPPPPVTAMMAAPADAPAPSAPTAPPAAGAAVAQQPTTNTVVAPTREMLDIEANVDIQVTNVKQAVKQLHALSARVGGVVTAERVDHSSRYGTAQLTLRVPSRATHGVFEELEKLGNVLNQTVNARDVSKEYFDSSLRLSSLEATLHRYEEILKRADKVEEILRIEQELARIRQEIEQVKGNLRFLQDRTARATLHLVLREVVPEVVHSEAEPEPKFYPGLRAPLLVDFGKTDEQTYGGGGLSLRFMRELSFDLDVLKRFDSEARGPDALIATAGGEIYSDLLGGGKRSYLNPYLGWRAGYARFAESNQAVLGATLGLELYKNRWFNLDVEARNYLVFLGKPGAHYGLSPALAANLAF